MAENEKPHILGQITSFIKRLTLSQRVFLGAVLLGTVLLILLVVQVANSLTYGILYSNLSNQDSATILERLQNQRIPYRISRNGGVIEVPDDRIPELRILLARDGIPAGGGVGFEIFDQQNALSTSDFVQNINFLRAKEGELARSIASLEEVLSAKVHITLPKPSVFMEEKEPAKASVVLRLRPGTQLAPDRGVIPAIIHLTAQSVEGLSAENIAVIDVSGRLLSRPRQAGDDFALLNNQQLTFQKQQEALLREKIRSQLEPVVGAGKVRADVSLTLDFNRVESTEEVFDPDRTAKLSEQKETLSNQGATPGGVPGVATNVAQAGSPGGSGGTGSSSESKKTTVNYQVSKRITHTQRPLGDISKLSVAVVVDHATEVQVENNALKRTPRPRTEEELESFRKLVQAAVGFNQERGDVVEVANIPFDTSMEQEQTFLQDKERTQSLVQTAIRYGSAILGALLVFFLILKPVARKAGAIISSAGSSRALAQEAPAAIAHERERALAGARDEVEIEQELQKEFRVSKETKKMSILRNKVKEFAEENLDATASLIKSYLMED